MVSGSLKERRAPQLQHEYGNEAGRGDRSQDLVQPRQLPHEQPVQQRGQQPPHRERDVLEELERELEEDPYADSEFSWLTDEPAEGTEPADAASEDPEKAQTMNMQTEETQTPQETKEEQQS